MVNWGELSASEKAEFMRIAIKGGINKLDDIRELYNSYKGGGGIHIKPSHRGRFTALQERTGKSASWYKAHGTPAQRKMATFALNARKWHHGEGGYLGDDDEEYFGGTLPAATITEWLPEVQSPEGKTIARNMVERVVNGNLQLKDVPRRYQSYVQGEAKGAIPMRDYMDKATNVALGTLAVPLAAMAVAEAAPAVAGSALWSNPITQQIVASEIGGRTVDLLSDSFTGKTWAENMSEGIKGATGWDPSQTWYGNMLSEMSNPGYMLSPSHFFTKEGVTRLSQSAFDANVKTLIDKNNVGNKILDYSRRKGIIGEDNKLFNSEIIRNPNNYYRSVEKDAIIDAEKTGIIRGNPNRIGDSYPFFARSKEPYDFRNYVIEGTPDSAKWISAYDYAYNKGNKIITELPHSVQRDFSKSYDTVIGKPESNGFQKIGGFDLDFLREYEALPMTNNDVNSSLASNFSYWKKYPILGWRKKEFNKNINDVVEFSQKLQQPVKKEAQQLPPYEIEDLGGGYMLKSLMRGNPLEKQISKQGTVSVNNINALINKGSNIEKAVVEKVLKSNEFAGKKSIDYNKFRTAVQDELISYNRTPDKRYKDYGMEKLGVQKIDPDGPVTEAESRNFNNYVNQKGYRFVEDWPGSRSKHFEDADGNHISYKDIIAEYNKENKVNTNTYTFSSPRIPMGSDKHYDANTLGHSRTYTTAKEPDVLHVMESQSDWAQGYQDSSKQYDELILINQDRVNRLRGDLQRGSDIFGLPINEIMMPELQKNLAKAEDDLAKSIAMKNQFSDQIAHEKHLTSNFTKRQIEENLKFAAEKGQTKMRYPTRETAAKIEGYPQSYDYFDNLGNRVNYDSAYGWEADIEAEILRLEEEFDTVGEHLPSVNSDYLLDLDAYEEFIERRSKAAFNMIAHPEDYIDGAADQILQENLVHRDKLNWMRNHPNEINELIEKRKSLLDQLNKVKSQNPKKLKPGFTEIKRYQPEHETILKKYSEFPKQFKRLYKNADVRTVTDSKGNTWYEVDVPKDYLNQEWEYSRVGNAMQRLSQLSQMMNQSFNQTGKVNINKYPEVQQFINDIYLPILRNEGSSFNMKDSAKSILTNEFAENIPIEIKNKISKFLSGTAGVAKDTGNIELGMAPSLKEHFKDIMHEINHIFRKNLAKTDDLNYGEFINGNHNGIPYRIAKDMENRFSKFQNKFNERFKDADMLNELSSTSSEIKMDLYIDYFTEHGKYPNAEQLKAYIDELSEEKLTRLFKETNSYGKNITNQIKKLDNTERSTANNDLKWLLKNVAILGLPIEIGSQLINNQDTNNQSWDFTQ